MSEQRLSLRSKRELAPPPPQLDEPEQALWTELLRTFVLNDVASLSILTATLEAHQRSRRCREQIEVEGQTVEDRFGQTKAHPLLAPEKEARSSYLAGMRILNLDLGTKR